MHTWKLRAIWRERKKHEPGRESQIQTDLNENSMICNMHWVMLNLHKYLLSQCSVTICMFEIEIVRAQSTG